MTEAEWLTPGDLDAHVEWLWRKNPLRELRLFSVACCRQLEPWIDDPAPLQAIERAEQLADGQLSDATLGKAPERDRLQRGAKEARDWTPQLAVYDDVRGICHDSRYGGFADCWCTLVYNGEVFGEEFVKRGPALAHALLLDVFGNPFRKVKFSKKWHTDTALALTPSDVRFARVLLDADPGRRTSRRRVRQCGHPLPLPGSVPTSAGAGSSIWCSVRSKPSVQSSATVH